MKTIITALAMTLTVFLGTGQSVAAQSYETGRVAYMKGDYRTALKIWRPLAEQGDARAQFGMGEMYATGNGVPQDNAQSVRWYSSSAQQGYNPAKTVLGIRME